MLLKCQLALAVLGTILVLTHGYGAVCPECRNGNYDCSQIYPRCGPNVDHLCFSNGVYYCAEKKICPECSVPGFQCVNKHPFCNRAVTTSLCYQGGELFCVEKIVPTTAAPPPTTTLKPTTAAPTTTAAPPTTAAPTTTVNPLTKCLTAGLISGCFLQCPTSWLPLIGKVCAEGTCCTKLP